MRNRDTSASYLRRSVVRKGRSSSGRRSSSNGTGKLDRIDPSRTGPLFRALRAEMARGVRRLRGALITMIDTGDALGLREGSHTAAIWGTTDNADATANAGEWRFETNDRKVERFRAWLRERMGSDLAGDRVISKYIELGYKKGILRSYDDTKRAAQRDARQKQLLEMFSESREGFVKASLGQRRSVEAVKLLAGRTFSEMEDLHSQTAAKMSRALADGLVRGKTPSEIAGDLVKELDLDRSRAETIARTEIVRAHSEGQLTALEQLGVEEVGVAVEWDTADDGHVCPKCEPLEGVVLTIDEARGLLPRHPNCRCAWVPANVGEEDTAAQVRSAKGIRKAMADSATAGTASGSTSPGNVAAYEVGRDGWTPPAAIGATRPTGNISPALLEFSRWLVTQAEGDNCGIGPGGFQPGNTCAKGGGVSRGYGHIAAGSGKAAGEVKRVVGQSIENLRSRYPALATLPDVDTIMIKKGDDICGQYFGGSGNPDQPTHMEIYPKHLSVKPAKLELGEHVVSGDIPTAVAHEYGHHLFGNLGKTDKSNWKEIYKSTPVKEWDKVSEYATSDYEEGFCESLAAYTHPSYKGGIPKRAEAYFDKLLNSSKLSANIEGENCGTGSGGFQPGNTCGRGTGTRIEKEAADAREVTNEFVKQRAPHPGSRPLGWYKENPEVVREDVAHELGIGTFDVTRAEQAHVSRRSWDIEEDATVVSALAEHSVIDSLKVFRGVAFSDPARAREYVEKTFGNGWYKTKNTGWPESFTRDPDVAEDFTTKTSAQMYRSGREKNASGVFIEVEGSKYGPMRGADLHYGEAESVLPRGQAYRVERITHEVDDKGYHTYRVRLRHDESVTGNVEGDNCGIGTGGFQPGNTCAKGGSSAGGYPSATHENIHGALKESGWLTSPSKLAKDLKLKAGEVKGVLKDLEQSGHVEAVGALYKAKGGEVSPAKSPASPTDHPTPPQPSRPAGSLYRGSEPEPSSPRAVAHLTSAVAEIDRTKNLYGLVHLGDVREALPGWSKSEFESVLERARREGTVSLQSGEGRYGFSERDLASGIRENPERHQGGIAPLMLYVSARKSTTGNQFCPTGEGGGVDPTCSPSTKSATAKASHKMVGRDIQRYAEEHNEPRFARVVGGKSLPDSEPVDVLTPKGDGVELKTMVDNANDKLTMDTYAQIRKVVWEKEQAGRTFHTVVSDDRKVYNANGPGQHDDTARVYYYRRGIAGSARVSNMLKVESEAELLRLMALPESELPAAAQRTDSKHFVGKWEAFVDEDGRAFRNSETNKVVRAKK